MTDLEKIAKLEALIAEIKAWLDDASTCRCYVCKHHRDIKAHIEKVQLHLPTVFAPIAKPSTPPSHHKNQTGEERGNET